MTDFRAMREKLETEIRRLQDDLRALARVEEMAQLSRNGAAPATPHRSRRRGRRRGPTRRLSAADAIKAVAQRFPDRLWTTVHMDEEVRRAGHHDDNFNKSNIGVTLRRLKEEGFFDIVSKSHKEGNVYKLKR